MQRTGRHVPIPHAIVGALERDLPPLLGIPHGGLGPQAFGEVDEHAGDVTTFRRVVPGQGDLDREHFARLSPAHDLGRRAGGDTPLAGKELAETVGKPLAVDVGDVLHAADAAQLLTRRAQHLLGGGVGVGQASLRIGRDDGDASRFGNGQERAFRSLQRHGPFCGKRLGTAADPPLREQQHGQDAVERERRRARQRPT